MHFCQPANSLSVNVAAGMIPMAAIYSQTWKHGNPLQDINDWARYLTAAAGNGVPFTVAPPNS